MKFIVPALASLLACSASHAQRPEEKLEEWGSRVPIEKIYFHFDREEYLAGETAFFKTYLASDYQPDTLSSVLYAELCQPGGSTISRKVLPILFGATNGHFDLPDSLRTGQYMVRAWTPRQMNQDPHFIFTRSIWIYGRKPANLYEEKTPALRLEFFPEGGNLVQGLQNTIAFKVTDEQGLPREFRGMIHEGNGREVARVKTQHDGMGMFDLTPGSGDYYAVAADEPGGPRYPLPPATERGVVLTLIPHPDGQFFELRQKWGDTLHRAAYMVGQMQHHVVFRQEFNSFRESIQGLIKTRDLRSGIMQVTIFNPEGIPLAERLCFVDNGEYRLEASLVPDTVGREAKDRNRFHVALRDTVDGNFSISVIDADYAVSREENIFSGLLLSSDLRGYVHRPAWYFTNQNDSTRAALDLLMMTHGWRRFSWTAVPAVSDLAYKDPGFVRIAGRVTLRESKKPFDQKRMLVYIIGSDSARTVQSVLTDREGRFLIDSLLFFGPARLLLSDARGKKGLYIDAALDGDTLHRFFNLPRLADIPTGHEFRTAGSTRERYLANLAALKEGPGITLEEVKLKVRSKSRLQEVEERYASGLFSGMSTKSIDLTDSRETAAYTNIFDYLQFRIPGLEIGTDGADYVVYYRQGPSASSMGEIPMTIFVNEVVSDATTVASIRANEVALVKVFSSFVGASGNGAGGVLAIYTKKGDDLFNISSGRSFNLRYNGFSVIREYYSPDYHAQPAERSQADRRITLQWKPDIMVRGINPDIPFVFYNNDSAKKFFVVVEGMTVDGRMVSWQGTF